MSIYIVAEPARTNQIFTTLILIKLTMVFYGILFVLSARDRRAMWAIKEGMGGWTKKTCIRFRKRKKKASYAYFVPGGG